MRIPALKDILFVSASIIRANAGMMARSHESEASPILSATPLAATVRRMDLSERGAHR